jgi:hypothetical protein
MAKKKTSKPKPTPAPKIEKPAGIMLQDLSGRLQTFNLPHEVYCKGSDTCECGSTERLTSVTRSDGKGGIKKTKIRLPRSINILPKETVGPFHECVKQCPEIKSALRARPTRLRVLPAGG